GTALPEGGEGQSDAPLPNGVRIMLDAEDVIRSFRPDWTRETGNQLALAFECAAPRKAAVLPRAGTRPRVRATTATSAPGSPPPGRALNGSRPASPGGAPPHGRTARASAGCSRDVDA